MPRQQLSQSEDVPTRVMDSYRLALLRESDTCNETELVEQICSCVLINQQVPNAIATAGIKIKVVVMHWGKLHKVFLDIHNHL